MHLRPGEKGKKGKAVKQAKAVVNAGGVRAPTWGNILF